jgi:glyoxylase-like metal-dependent hydrolase (beta-lactamase superfamily II)
VVKLRTVVSFDSLLPQETGPIVLTHAHGSLDALAQALPGVDVAMSARDARFLTGDKSLDADEPQSKLRGSYVTTSTRPGTLLEPGDRVGSLEVVAAPGHTPGQIALVDTRDRTIIAGDAFSTLGGVATSAKVNWRFPLVASATWDRPTALRTARALRGLEPARLAAGHGPVVEAPGAAMDRAIGRAA